MNVRAKTTFKGVDLSKHQPAGKVNFNALKALDYEFVMLRAGYGKYESQKDKAFDRHYKKALEAGLKAGAYHYSYAVTVKDAEQEADCFLKWIKGRKLLYPVAFDIEDRRQKKLTIKQRTDIALVFMQKVESAGYYTMLYSSASWLGSKLDMSNPALRHFDVWCAAYMPKDRIKRYYNGSYGIWQYSSGIILPSVYKGRLDHNIAYKDYGKIITAAGLNHLN